MKRLILSTVAIGLAASTGVYAQISTINSAVVVPRVFDDIPAATFAGVNNYPGSISLSETNVSSSTGFANRDVWRYSANGSTAYQFQGNQYFNASFQLTLTGSGTPGIDLEAGWLFSNPSGHFGGDLQTFATAGGVVAQTGGPSYYPFSPAAGGYPPAAGSSPPGGVPNYVLGQTYTLGLNYVWDPVTSMSAFQYSVNGVFALSAPGDTYFDLGPGQFVGGAGDVLGGYFQIQTNAEDPNNNGTAVFSNITITAVPEPSALALLGLGILPLVFRRRR
jgi:hypothetical protein